MSRELVAEIAQILEPWAWETKSWNATQARDDATAKAEQIVEFLVASSASLSGGAEEVDWRKVAKLAGEHGVRYRTNAGMAKFIAALYPSPKAPSISTFVRGGESLFEAPANRQGTCTCNGAGQWPLVELEHAPGCPRGPANRQEAGEVERLREELAWYGEQARLARLIHSEGDAGRHALAEDGGKRAQAVLTSPKDVKGVEA